MTTQQTVEANETFATVLGAIADNMARAIQGKDDVIELMLLCLVSEGHLLLEDVPGVGKTSLAKALAASIDGSFSRVQFTPDVLPTDVLGVNVWDRDNVRGRVTVRAIIPDVRASVREARQAGADVVVVVLHSGLSGVSSYDTTSTGAASETVVDSVSDSPPRTAAVVTDSPELESDCTGRGRHSRPVRPTEDAWLTEAPAAALRSAPPRSTTLYAPSVPTPSCSSSRAPTRSPRSSAGATSRSSGASPTSWL